MGSTSKIPVAPEGWAYLSKLDVILNPQPYLEVHCTYNLLSNWNYNPNISPITTGTLDIIGL